VKGKLKSIVFLKLVESKSYKEKVALEIKEYQVWSVGTSLEIIIRKHLELPGLPPKMT